MGARDEKAVCIDGVGVARPGDRDQLELTNSDTRGGKQTGTWQDWSERTVTARDLLEGQYGNASDTGPVVTKDDSTTRC